MFAVEYVVVLKVNPEWNRKPATSGQLISARPFACPIARSFALNDGSKTGSFSGSTLGIVVYGVRRE
jgi:hypothetical protein